MVSGIIFAIKSKEAQKLSKVINENIKRQNLNLLISNPIILLPPQNLKIDQFFLFLFFSLLFLGKNLYKVLQCGCFIRPGLLHKSLSTYLFMNLGICFLGQPKKTCQPFLCFIGAGLLTF